MHAEKKKSDFFKAIGLTTADKAKLETVATLDAVGATKLFKEWVTAHVEVSTQPAGNACKEKTWTLPQPQDDLNLTCNLCLRVLFCRSGTQEEQPHGCN